ncbi:MAG: C40 family peptidase [Muribaculaceae bacterium]|nr:C40 family peptidase [Muribaculaceae bacterium]
MSTNKHIKYYFSAVALALCPLATVASDVSDPFATDDFDVFLSAVEKTLQLEELSRREALTEDIINFANSFLGKPYRRGAKGPKAFDCSGFTSYVFRQFNTRLGASSRAQYLQGEAVETEDVRPGDLLFFSGRRAGKTVGHVGIAVDIDDKGNISFIHAANTGGIRIDKVQDGGYYSRRYIGARRVI